MVTWAPPVSFSGLVSGLNTQSIINAEMAVYEQPLTTLQTEQTTINTKITDYQAINTQLLSLQQSASTPWADPVALQRGLCRGVLEFFHRHREREFGDPDGFAHVRSRPARDGINADLGGNGCLSERHRRVRHGPRRLRRSGTRHHVHRRGYRTGHRKPHDRGHPVVFWRDRVRAPLAVAASTTIGASNDQLDVEIDGAAQSLTLAAGTYTPAQLAQAVEQASGGSLTASVSASGELSVATAEQGSGASLQITGGSGLPALALSAGSTVAGTDGVVTVDGTSTAVSDIAGSGTTSVVLNSGTGGLR